MKGSRNSSPIYKETHPFYHYQHQHQE